MGAIILNIAFLVSGLLMLPPIVTIFGKGLQASPIDGAKELIGAQNFVQADLDSPLLAHVFWIDWGKNVMIGLLCFAAVFVFDLSAKRATALIMIVHDLWACAVQVITPIGGVKPWAGQRSTVCSATRCSCLSLGASSFSSPLASSPPAVVRRPQSQRQRESKPLELKAVLLCGCCHNVTYPNTIYSSLTNWDGKVQG